MTNLRNDIQTLRADFEKFKDFVTGRRFLWTGLFTPTLTFGGGATGMTYARRVGRFTRYNDLVTFMCRMDLSAKGTSIGPALVTGLPFVCRDPDISMVDIGLNGVPAGHGDGMSWACVRDGTSQIELFWLGPAATTVVPFSDGSFTNTTLLALAGSYRV